MEQEKKGVSKTEEKEEQPEPQTEETKEEELEVALEETPEEITKEEAEEEQKEEEVPAAEVKEEIKPEKEEKPEEEIVEERIYTVPLGKAWIMPPHKRTPRAMRMLRIFLTKHMKLEAKKEGETEEESEPGQLIISNEVNERMWTRGVEKPPRKIRVRAAKDKEGNVTVYLAEGD
jgi:large subunit ribosomal protein L31e